MKENYDIKIHDMDTNKIYIYNTFATSLEDAYIQAKIMHSRHKYTQKKNAEKITKREKHNNENQ